MSVEKDTLRQQIVQGFDRYGIPVVVLRGYGSLRALRGADPTNGTVSG